MKKIVIKTIPGFDEWRGHARQCLYERLSPDQVLWQDINSPAQDLFANTLTPSSNHPAAQPMNTVSRTFISMAELAACHQSPDRFDLLYRLLWRMTYKDRHLLKHITGPDVMTLTRYIKAVRRDI